jgi:hypothetical protein
LHQSNIWIRIKHWFDDSPYITRVDKKHFKIIHGGIENGDVAFLGKTCNMPDIRIIGIKGKSLHAISLPDDVAESIVDENRKAAIIIVQLDSCNEQVFVICKTNSELIKKIYRKQ